MQGASVIKYYRSGCAEGVASGGATRDQVYSIQVMQEYLSQEDQVFKQAFDKRSKRSRQVLQGVVVMLVEDSQERPSAAVDNKISKTESSVVRITGRGPQTEQARTSTDC